MRHLQLTLDTLAENLALDEALLDACEAGELPPPLLRLWEADDYGVVLGRSSQAEVEVDLDACRRDGVPVLRRSSGGGTIVTGPGCMMYAVVLSFADHPQIQQIDAAHEFVLTKIATMLKTDEAEVQRAGTSDLAILSDEIGVEQKFSGNALRVKRDHLLYHGTLLYDFELDRIPRWLATPTRTPTYRDERAHAEFVTNLAVDRQTLARRLLDGWQASQPLTTWPVQLTNKIIDTKYLDDPKWVIHDP